MCLVTRPATSRRLQKSPNGVKSKAAICILAMSTNCDSTRSGTNEIAAASKSTVNGASLLWSTIRVQVLSITSRMQAGPVMLPTVHFHDLRKPLVHRSPLKRVPHRKSVHSKSARVEKKSSDLTPSYQRLKPRFINNRGRAAPWASQLSNVFLVAPGVESKHQHRNFQKQCRAILLSACLWAWIHSNALA